MRHISKSLRFDVLNRDNFTCQYCGSKAPDVVLEIDHIIPYSVSKNNDIKNLITSCRTCNNGKSDKFVYSLIKNESKEVKKEIEERKKIKFITENLSILDCGDMLDSKGKISHIRSKINGDFKYIISQIEEYNCFISKYNNEFNDNEDLI